MTELYRCTSTPVRRSNSRAALDRQPGAQAHLRPDHGRGAPAESLLAGLLRYHLDAPEGWQTPPALAARVLRRETGLGKSTRLVAAGIEPELVAEITSAGAGVREVSRLSLAETVPILLQSEIQHDFA